MFLSKWIFVIQIELEFGFSTNIQPDVVMHLAAESHVDRSIDKPLVISSTNVCGVLITLLELAVSYWFQLNAEKESKLPFHIVST